MTTVNLLVRLNAFMGKFYPQYILDEVVKFHKSCLGGWKISFLILFK